MNKFCLVVADYKELPPHLIVENEFWVQMLVMFGVPERMISQYFGLN